MAEAPAFLVVGHLNKAHGTGGELFVQPLTDHPESTFVPGVVLRLDDGSGQAPDPFQPPVTVEAVRPFQQGYLVRIQGVTDRNGAERLRGRYLLRPFEEAAPPGPDELFYHQLLGMDVVTSDGRPVGRVIEVYEMDPADLLELEGPDGTVRLLPFARHLVDEVDVDGGRIVVTPPDGLLDL